MLKVLQLHAEHVVELLDDVTLGSQLADGLDTVHLHGVERSLDGAILSQVGGIDVPSRVNLCGEHNLAFSTFACLQLCCEVDGVNHLSLYCCQHSQ